jgi:hypothetical protein
LHYLGRETPVTIKETVCLGLLLIGNVKLFVEEVITIFDEAKGI